jgi:hypothetical protein
LAYHNAIGYSDHYLAQLADHNGQSDAEVESIMFGGGHWGCESRVFIRERAALD